MNDLNFSPIERPAALQKVVIVGRPNVGKSTLFNRLLGRRRAITDAMPGVTRDPVESPCTIEGRSFALVDTGGFKLERDAMDDLINGRIFKSLSEAALILFVLDIIEFTPEDEEFCDQLRAYSSKVLLVVNKMDTSGRDDLLWNHFSLGFGRTLGISAAHSRGMEELEKAIVDFLGPAGETEAPVRGEAGIRLAILGKPNTGKSTLVNTLTGKDVSLVSAIPGTTRDVIEGFFAFKGRSFRILDTAGIRRKNRVNQDVEYYSVHKAFKAVEEADVVYLLVDASEEVSDQDKKIAEQVVKRGKGIIIVLNKWDVRLATNDALEKPFSKDDVFKAVRDRVRFVFPVLKFAPIVPISALEQTGLDKLINITLTVYGQLNRSLDTSKLNSMMGKWLMDYTPPRDRAAQFKPRYITQTGTNPVKFLLFVNRVKGFPEGWVQYLKNKLRKDAGLDSIPFSIDLKQS